MENKNHNQESQYLCHKTGLLKEEYYKKVISNSENIESIIVYDRDYHFDYFALTTLIRAYLLKFENKTTERPQDLWMRIALTVSCNEFNFNKVKKTYDALSNGYYTHATPTLFNFFMFFNRNGR